MCLDPYSWELDLYFGYLNLYFVSIALYLVPELILLGEGDLCSEGTQAPAGPKWDPSPDWRGPNGALGPEPLRGDFLGSNWSRKQNRHGHMYTIHSSWLG